MPAAKPTKNRVQGDILNAEEFMFDSVPSPGRIVHYVMENGDYTKEGAYGGASAVPVKGGTPSNLYRHRPAIIVETWQNETQPDPAKWAINLVVFVDGMNDGYPTNTLWKTSVPYSPKEMTPGTWHWPERA